jgi:hypothetical protein
MTQTPKLGHELDCPECVQGKHRNCTHMTLDPDTDQMVPCDCESGGHL